jgi:3',5'-cyclic AMP phosphodiesterase CpdA
MMIAQITDTHVQAAPQRALGGDASERLLKVVRAINAASRVPDLVLVTGDLVNDGGTGDYEHLRKILSQLDMPYFVIPGNHDDRDALRGVFRQDGYLPERGYLNYVIDGFPLRLIGLDTLYDGHPGGRLCLDRLHWLEEALEAGRDTPTVLFMHHVPFQSGIAPFDRDPMEGADALASILSGNPQVQRVLCGHLHRPVTTKWHGVTISVAPSPAFEVTLDLRESAGFSIVPGAAPGYQLHLWTKTGGLVSHTLTV